MSKFGFQAGGVGVFFLANLAISLCYFYSQGMTTVTMRTCFAVYAIVAIRMLEAWAIRSIASRQIPWEACRNSRARIEIWPLRPFLSVSLTPL